MQAVTTIGLDIAKSIFQVHGVFLLCTACGLILVAIQTCSIQTRIAPLYNRCPGYT
jgi:hypothetical protein